MIGSLAGQIIYRKPPWIILEVNGVGYELAVSMNTFCQLPLDDGHVRLFTHLVVREDAQDLYGFSESTEKDLFRILIKVNGIGPKLALAILSSQSPQEFGHCIATQDSAALLKIPGVGKKMAERLIIEMSDKLSDSTSLSISVRDSSVLRVPAHQQDAIGALISLGYKSNDARKVVMSVENDSCSSEELIREALKQLAG